MQHLSLIYGVKVAMFTQTAFFLFLHCRINLLVLRQFRNLTAGGVKHPENKKSIYSLRGLHDVQ